ncbi:MAG: hypothetical protein L6V81_05660 [Clostridium sp.]|nr:MAG: hypothetical protein L6V81_05660 [Clostridium sp.]
MIEMLMLKIGTLTSKKMLKRIFDSFNQDIKSIDRTINIVCGKICI